MAPDYRRRGTRLSTSRYLTLDDGTNILPAHAEVDGGDRALSNPPTHAGDAVLADLFSGWSNVLASDGELRVVHHRALDLDHHLDRFEAVHTVSTGEDHVVRAA